MKKREMIELIPVLLLPYYILLSNYFSSYITSEILLGIFNAFNIIFFGYSVIVIIYRSIVTINDKSETKDLIKINLLIKIVYFIGQIIYIVLVVIGFISSIYGLMLSIWAFVIFLLLELISGIMSISSTIKLKRLKLLNKFDAFVFSLAHFVFIFDLISCFYYLRIINRNE